MSEQTPVPADHLIMRAWKAYKLTEDYRNSRRWAKHDEHLDGAMWATFERGYRAATGAQAVTGGAPLCAACGKPAVGKCEGSPSQSEVERAWAFIDGLYATNDATGRKERVIAALRQIHVEEAEAIAEYLEANALVAEVKGKEVKVEMPIWLAEQEDLT